MPISLHKRLTKCYGYKPVDTITLKNPAISLSIVALAIANKKYNAFKIVPVTMAFEHEMTPKFIPEEVSHIVYALINFKHPEFSNRFKNRKKSTTFYGKSLSEEDGNRYFVL